jgi:hypothetical protein
MIGPAITVKLASGTSIFWTAQPVTSTLTTGASKVMTFTPKVSN